ncbi:tyrosine-protein phosphatase [Lactobacillus sp. PV012]|nr:tyrosine-protein phosphatase [Lactobacillus sp. PV012]
MDVHLYEEGDEKISPEINEKSVLVEPLPLVKTYLGQIYQKALLNPVAKMAFRKVFETLLTLKQDQALVFHCTMGKDRTGIVAALILIGLSVDLETITKDYLLTNKVELLNWQDQYGSGNDLEEMIEKMNVTAADQESILALIETLKSFGGFKNYFINELGFTESDFKSFRENYLN